MLTAGKARSPEAGFTYVMILVAVLSVGLMAGVATELSSRQVRADREAELMFRGIAYRNAIKSYYEAGAQKGFRAFPRNLEDLVFDPRFASKRHLRAAYPDPFGTGTKEWNLIRAADGGIAGVASKSQEEPFKKSGFPKDLEKFSDAKSYSEWVFEYVPKQSTPGASSPVPAPITPPVLNTF